MRKANVYQLFTVDAPGAEFTDAGGDWQDDISEDDLEPTLEYAAEEQELEAGEATAPGSLWSDPADAAVSVSMQSNKRLRKLARGRAAEDQVSGNDLHRKLREQCVHLLFSPRPCTDTLGLSDFTQSLSGLRVVLARAFPPSRSSCHRLPPLWPMD